MRHLAVSGVIPDWTLGDRLRKAREARGLSQTELSEMADISRRSISKYEADEAMPRRPQLLAWAMATGVPTDWLEQGESVRPKGLEPPTFWSVLWERGAWSVTRFATRSTLRADDLALAA
jgi:transcriptional regulator with XRE-family HTH domain